MQSYLSKLAKEIINSSANKLFTKKSYNENLQISNVKEGWPGVGCLYYYFLLV